MHTPLGIFFRGFLIFLCSFGWSLTSCGEKANGNKPYVARGRKVEIVKENGNFTLLRNGEPYFIKGAGGYTDFDKIKAMGGNSVRVWHTDNAQEVLDEAHKRGLTVMLGLWMAAEKDGFNYYDKELVAQQFRELRKQVLLYKDHPALLMWGLGNELNLESSNTKVWDAVNEIAEMIHEVDPDHPTTTMIVGARTKLINLIIRECPAIDVLSINTFGPMANMPMKIRESDWKGPYIISEFGARGYWETYTTWWLAPLEQTSSQKAEFVKERYSNVIRADNERCLGGYVFYWGYKHEGTPTWFSLFSKTGEATQLVNVMGELWTGDSAHNNAPYIAYVKLNNAFDYDNVYLKTQQEYDASVYTFDPEGDSLRVTWQILPETFDEHGNENKKINPLPIPGLIEKADGNKVRIKAPTASGPYRLFAYVFDGQGHVATANIPFYVNEEGGYVKRQ